jgi:hypothetical protein
VGAKSLIEINQGKRQFLSYAALPGPLSIEIDPNVRRIRMWRC